MKRIQDFLIEYQGLIRILIYLLITVACSVYIIKNWNEALSFTFFSDFNGMNLLFIIWILLLLLPIVGNYEGFGFKIDFWERHKREKVADKEKELEEKLSSIESTYSDGGDSNA